MPRLFLCRPALAANITAHTTTLPYSRHSTRLGSRRRGGENTHIGRVPSKKRTEGHISGEAHSRGTVRGGVKVQGKELNICRAQEDPREGGREGGMEERGCNTDT